MEMKLLQLFQVHMTLGNVKKVNTTFKNTEFRLRYFTVQIEQARSTSCLLYDSNNNFQQSPCTQGRLDESGQLIRQRVSFTRTAFPVDSVLYLDSLSGRQCPLPDSLSSRQCPLPEQLNQQIVSFTPDSISGRQCPLAYHRQDISAG